MPHDNGTRAAFWQSWLAELKGIFILRAAWGVVGVL